jgi:hypothetical protein
VFSFHPKDMFFHMRARAAHTNPYTRDDAICMRIGTRTGSKTPAAAAAMLLILTWKNKHLHARTHMCIKRIMYMCVPL